MVHAIVLYTVYICFLFLRKNRIEIRKMQNDQQRTPPRRIQRIRNNQSRNSNRASNSASSSVSSGGPASNLNNTNSNHNSGREIVPMYHSRLPPKSSQIAGVYGTIDGRIWVQTRNRILMSKAIIRSEKDIRIQNPYDRISNLDPGPTGRHDVIVSEKAKVEVCYCHQIVAKLQFEGFVSLHGRTFLVNADGCNHDDDDEDEVIKEELEAGDHIRVVSGNLRIRVSAEGHRVYIGTKSDATNSEATDANQTNEELQYQIWRC